MSDMGDMYKEWRRHKKYVKEHMPKLVTKLVVMTYMQAEHPDECPVKVLDFGLHVQHGCGKKLVNNSCPVHGQIYEEANDNNTTTTTSD
jgi:hypothetical protein